MRLDAITQWDARASLALQARRTRAMNALCQALSWSGAGGVWFGAAAVLWWAQRAGREFVPGQATLLAGMTGAFATLLVGGLLKRAVGRRRPFVADVGVRAAIWAPGPSRSFPSTHAATSVCLATALLASGHPLARWTAAWAVGVSFSRVWLGVHYVSDVLGGAALGVAFGVLPWAQVLR
ncbi:MAG: phosphatase PAP2 family protein [Myxococcaceae bacterium]|jgi:membrane-associated phospholipid phosphatase|nr:phosphatase PAP2 family protein [Myxococcaceae bacterium]MCA3015568.1 phosphatase PAP2 family protein [Myxococcaceae bacterium]